MRGQCEDHHTPRPGGYEAFKAWAKEMSRTHHQARCPVCGRWDVWLPKTKRKMVKR